MRIFKLGEPARQFFIPKEALEVIKNLQKDFQCGRTELPNGAYMNAETYSTKSSSRFEAHRRFIDVQIIVEGTELVHLAPITDKFVQIEPYNETRDIEFMAGEVKDTVLLHAGEFCVITPEWAHMPCMAVNGSAPVKKVVVKVPIMEQ